MIGLLLPLLSYTPPPAVLDSTAKVVGQERAVALWERAKRDDEGFAFLNTFSVLSNLSRRYPDSVEALVAPYLRFVVGRPLPGDRERYVRAVVLSSGGDGELEEYLLRGCKLSPEPLPKEWKEMVDRALDSLIAYAEIRSFRLERGIYYGPALEGTTYAFRGLTTTREVAWGSPPALIMEVKRLYPFYTSFLLSIGDLAFNVPSLALAYGRLKGSGEGVYFILKHAYAGRFASLTEYAPTPYEPCLPESLYWAVAQHPKVVGVMLAHSYVNGMPASLSDSLVMVVRRETGKLVFPDWLNMGAVKAAYILFGSGPLKAWLADHTRVYPATPPYDLGSDYPLLDDAHDLWNSPALLSDYFVASILQQLGWEGKVGVGMLPSHEGDPSFWAFVGKVEEEVGWVRIYTYAYWQMVKRLLALVDSAVAEEEMERTGGS